MKLLKSSLFTLAAMAGSVALLTSCGPGNVTPDYKSVLVEFNLKNEQVTEEMLYAKGKLSIGDNWEEEFEFTGHIPSANLLLGTYDVVFELEGYDPIEFQLELTDDEVGEVLVIDLEL